MELRDKELDKKYEEVLFVRISTLMKKEYEWNIEVEAKLKLYGSGSQLGVQ